MASIILKLRQIRSSISKIKKIFGFEEYFIFFTPIKHKYQFLIPIARPLNLDFKYQIYGQMHADVKPDTVSILKIKRRC